MKGKIAVSVKNRHIAYKLVLERNITVITGDSGTGKTKLINMVRAYAIEGKSSGVTLKCDKNCIVLEGNNWDVLLEKIHDSIVFIEESTKFLNTHEFALAIQNTDNYYVIVSREPMPQISYSVDSIKQIIKHDQKPKIENLYKNIRVKDILKKKYDVIIVEDAKTGFQFFSKAAGKMNTICNTAKGKSNILKELNRQTVKSILVIADAAAFGSEIREVMQFKQASDKQIDLFLPESFEWLILKSVIFSNNTNVRQILANPVDYIECKDYFSWERYFTDLLVSESKGRKQLSYPASKSKLPAGYLTDSNMDSIINAMK